MITALNLSTKENIEFIDITERLESLIKDVNEGHIVVLTQHTTTGLWINEAEEGLIKDMKRKLEEFAPTEHYYEHDDFKKRKCLEDERRNGFSHLRTIFFNSSIAIPVKSGKLMLGKYQSVFFVELDGPRENRTLIAHVCSNKV